MNLIKATIILFISIIIIGCKNDFLKVGGPTKVTLTFNSEAIRASQEQEQVITTEINSSLNIKATLTPIDNSYPETSISTKSQNLVAANPVKKELKENTLIKILVYNANGTKFHEINHIYKSSGDQIEIDEMVIGQSYTFIAYSINSTQNLPEPENKQLISNLQIRDLSTEFLYYKEVITIAKNNNLNISLKHKFSEIISSLTIDQTGNLQGSKVTQMTAPTISPAYSNVPFNLNTGTAIIDSRAILLPNGKPLPLSSTAISQNPITTTPVLVITPGTNNELNISSLTINGMTNTIKLSGFNLTPGVRYTLKLEIACPCTKDVTTAKAIDRPQYSSTDSEFIYTDANYGMVLDIYRIDNSFNLRINDTHIFSGTSTQKNSGSTTYPTTITNELQFQGFGLYPNRDLIPNIEFEDGTRWGIDANTTNRNEIWHFDGRPSEKAIIRLIIDKEGEVKMYGSRNNDGGEPFYPLRIINNQDVTVRESNVNYTYTLTGQLNKVTWNNSTNNNSNTILLSQSRKDANDATSFQGSITGKQIINCTP